MLKNERMHKVLEGRRVVMVPDNAQFYNWSRTAQKYGYRISNLMEVEAPFEGADILDIFTEYNKNKNNEDIYNYTLADLPNETPETRKNN